MTTCARDNLKQWIDYSTEKDEIPDELCGTTEKSSLAKGNAKRVDLFFILSERSSTFYEPCSCAAGWTAEKQTHQTNTEIQFETINSYMKGLPSKLHCSVTKN